MRLETRTKKLARTVFLISAGSVAVIALVIALTAPQNIPARHAAGFRVYTYQNPFSRPENMSPATLSAANTDGLLNKLFSVKCLAGMSSLGVLWLGASCYLYGGHSKRKRIRHTVEFSVQNRPKMNPLACVPPKPVTRVGEEDTVRITVLPRATVRNRFVHRHVTAPCQSRFRPTALGSSQTRFGRLL